MKMNVNVNMNDTIVASPISFAKNTFRVSLVREFGAGFELWEEICLRSSFLKRVLGEHENAKWC
jgi:hypothetical protein